jgi:hypothetical protein
MGPFGGGVVMTVARLAPDWDLPAELPAELHPALTIAAATVSAATFVIPGRCLRRGLSGFALVLPPPEITRVIASVLPKSAGPVQRRESAEFGCCDRGPPRIARHHAWRLGLGPGRDHF